MQHITEHDRDVAMSICGGHEANAENLLRLWNAERGEDTEIDDPRGDDEWLDEEVANG